MRSGFREHLPGLKELWLWAYIGCMRMPLLEKSLANTTLLLGLWTSIKMNLRAIITCLFRNVWVDARVMIGCSSSTELGDVLGNKVAVKVLYLANEINLFHNDLILLLRILLKLLSILHRLKVNFFFLFIYEINNPRFALVQFVHRLNFR